MANEDHIKLCIIRKSSIGDVILSTIVLEYIKKTSKPYSIIWIGSKPSLELVQTNYPDIQCFEYSNRHAALKAIDSSYIWVDLQSTLKTILFYFVYCISQKRVIKRHGLQKRRMHRYWVLIKNRFFNRTRTHKTRTPKHTITGDLQTFIKSILKKNYRIDHGGQVTTDLSTLASAIEPHPVLQELDFGSWVCVAPGAKYNTKKLPADLVSNFLKKNVMSKNDSTKPQLVFVGGKDEQELIAKICNELEGKFHYLNLCGKLSLSQTAIAISKARFTIAADSALAHLSEALHIKTFMIYGPTAPEFGFNLHHPKNHSLSSPIGCSPCSRHGKASCRYGDYACYYQTNLEPIQAALQNMLK